MISWNKTKVLVGDFETTVYTGQEFTEVWASAVVEIGSEDAEVFHSIDETFEYLNSINKDVIIYYHNLKFDGEFWLYYLAKKLNYKQAFSGDIEKPDTIKMLKKREMPSKSFTYAISDRGQWYKILIKTGKHTIEIRDSLKLLPFSVKQIGESFKTKHKKLEMEYKGKRYAGCTITDEEKEYIKNDVLVVKEALEFMFEQGHDSLTIGACCLTEYKRIIGKRFFRCYVPRFN